MPKEFIDISETELHHHHLGHNDNFTVWHHYIFSDGTRKTYQQLHLKNLSNYSINVHLKTINDN